MTDRMKEINERRRTIKVIEATGEGVNRIHAELYFSRGGISYSTYKHEERGFYLSVRPELFTEQGNFTSTQTTAFSGLKICIAQASRFNKKTFSNLVPDEELIQSLVDSIVKKSNLVLTQLPEAA